MQYKTPNNRYYRLHHVRPRFKNDVESVLLYMANEVSSLGSLKSNEFKDKLNLAIKLYPGNYSKKDKTINNWRTEISALFGLIQYDTNKVSRPSEIARILSEKQDLIEFFRYFLYYFQYPGGHLKPQETLNLIKSGIKFHPTRYLLDVLLVGRDYVNGNKFGLTKAEATHCIFNDLAVTKDNRPAIDTVKLIIHNRDSGLEYDGAGDITRYAGDILDYMELADLVRLRPDWKFYPNMHHLEVLRSFIDQNSFFPPYENLYNKNDITIADITENQSEWFNYINANLNSTIFKADIFSILSDEDNKKELDEKTSFIYDFLNKVRSNQESKNGIKTKEIGDVGEAIILEHEKNRMKSLSRNDLIHLIKKIPETFGMGFDIKSFLGMDNDFSNIHIEVKTTISRGKLSSQSFHMTPNEWNSAESYKDMYFIYRLMLSTNNISLFVIRNPVGAYKTDLLQMLPRNGADIKYNDKSGEWKELLV